MREPLPHRRQNFTQSIDWAGHAVTVTVGLRVDGTPAEVFADTAKGGDMAATLADACVLISIALQHGIAPVDLAKSLGRVPLLRAPEKLPDDGAGETKDAGEDAGEDEPDPPTDAPASPIGAIVAVLL